MASASLTYVEALREENGGFCFDEFFRNKHIFSKEFQKKTYHCKDGKTDLDQSEAMKLLKPRKTGTTICGVITKEGVVLGADTRATEGPIVAMKNCEKLRRLTKNIYIAGAGVSADLHHVAALMESKLELLRLESHTEPRVITAVTMFQQLLFSYQGYITCAIVLGGVDFTGAQLYMIHPHGSCDKLPFCSMGSGSLNALSVLESTYKDNLTLEEGKKLAAAAIKAGVLNDLGSGGNVDLAIMPCNTTNYPYETSPAFILRAYKPTTARPYTRQFPVEFPSGFTPILQERIESIRPLIEVVEEPLEDDEQI